ncbi:Piso0_004977 [Millerozyma farinosa CBS 7064]|uniref:Piso0_004977 protein n=1 Tax=Pichia sorbitophila (strain ATCC MYA-4447 / BCRC 22081 / CBS 7064 / NBRC 10061 / NRRL Y-12695) TaxID=559304 RepID=G8Y0Y1_PICSO|nr:Piso0_004977 [Millerozyma farinosa CBS 7064]
MGDWIKEAVPLSGPRSLFCVGHHKHRDRATVIAAIGGHRQKKEPTPSILTLRNKNKVSGDWTERRAETTTYSWYVRQPRWDSEGTAAKEIIPNLGRWCSRRELYGLRSAVCTKSHKLGTAQGSLRRNLQRQKVNQWGSKVPLGRKDCSG